MVNPQASEEETTITRREVGYAWSYSLESGPSGNRQKTHIGGNEDTLPQALTQLRRVKAEVLRLSQASLEALVDAHGREAQEQREVSPV